MACSEGTRNSEGNSQAYQPYNDSIMPQNSADGSYDSTFYIRDKVRDDLGSDAKRTPPSNSEDPGGNAEVPIEENEFFN